MEELQTTFESKGSNPDEFYDRLEFSENIQKALLKVDSKYRALIILKHFQNCSYQQIAEIVDIPEKTVKSRLYIARQQLSKVLIQGGFRLYD
jgi:RNA polymerase sigma-70 factor (ECF subfamily)